MFFFITFSLSTELLEDKQRFKLGGVDTSPTHLLFQTRLPLFWTLTCMVWMELTRTDAVFSRIAMVLFMCRNKSSQNDLKLHGTSIWKIRKIPEERSTSGGPPPVHEGGGRAPCLVSPLTLHRPQPWLHIFTFGEKKIREKDSSRFTIRSRRQALKPLGRADLESVRGSGEGIRRHRHHQPYSITNFMMLTAVRE